MDHFDVKGRPPHTHTLSPLLDDHPSLKKKTPSRQKEFVVDD
jgi:hypothetical protein